MPPNAARVVQIARAVTDEPDVGRGLRSLIKGIAELLGANHAALYRLYLDRSQYVMQLGYLLDQDQFVSNPPDLGLNVNDLLKQQPEQTSLLGRAIVTRSIISTQSESIERPSYMSERSGFTLLVPIIRGQSCLGVLRLDSPNVEFAGVITYEIEFARSLIVSLFERQSSLSLLQAVQRPIDFTQSLEGFLDDILLLIAEAARMPYIQIHELEPEQGLRCIAQYGLRAVERQEFDLQPVEAFGSLSDAVNKSVTVLEPTIDIPRLAALRERTGFSDIKSFVVVPIRMGTAVFGTVLFGASCPFDYSPLEIAGFESIASNIGTAIANSRNAHQLRDLSIADARIGLATSALEVAQAARHEVSGAVDDCMANLAVLQGRLKRGMLAEANKTIERVEERLLTINSAMEKIKAASRSPDDTLQSVSLVDIWQQARALVSAKLAQEQIETRITCLGKDIRVEILPDSLRHAFLHLLLNSIDAFKTKRKSDRLITISIDPRSDVAVDVRIRYTDNASGIDPAQFRQQLDTDSAKDIKQLIFEKGVTTKPSGSGFGLYLVRAILARHHASIELVNHRGGVVFDITIPRHLKAIFEHRERKG